MNWIDLILLVVLFLFGLRGYFKGLFRETFSLGGLVIGFMVAVRYDEAVAAWAGFYWNVSSIILKGAAFVVIFFVVYFIFAVAGWVLHRAAKSALFADHQSSGGYRGGSGQRHSRDGSDHLLCDFKRVDPSIHKGAR